MTRVVPWQKGLTVNGHKFTFRELLAFSQDKIESPDSPRWVKDIFRFLLDWSGDHDHIIQLSSGTTGRSKEIKLSKLSMMDSALATCTFFGLGKGATALLCLPVTYVAGKMMIVRSIVGELNLQLSEPTSRPDISGIQTIDFCAMVPLQVLNLMNSRIDLLSLKKLIIGGSEISPGLVNKLLDVSAEVYATYGMAETCSHVAIRKLNGADRHQNYHALPGVNLTQDERNCLVISANWIPHPVITNDMVKFTGTDSFTWLGRFDNLINSGGIKIVPEETESLIAEKTGLECALIGIPDEVLGQRLVLVAEKYHPVADESWIMSELQKLFPPNLLPKKIILVEKLPRNNSFKLDRKTLTNSVSRI